MKQLKNCF